MSSAAGNSIRGRAQGTPRAPDGVRLKVEQASYAYSATDRRRPKFTLGPVSFEARERELVAILGPERERQINAVEIVGGLDQTLVGTRGSGWRRSERA